MKRKDKPRHELKKWMDVLKKESIHRVTVQSFIKFFRDKYPDKTTEIFLADVRGWLDSKKISQPAFNLILSVIESQLEEEGGWPERLKTKVSGEAIISYVDFKLQFCGNDKQKMMDNILASQHIHSENIDKILQILSKPDSSDHDIHEPTNSW